MKAAVAVSEGKPASTNQSVATANDWPQHAASCHWWLPKLAAITIKVGALLQDEGPWFFTLFSREEHPLLHTNNLATKADAQSPKNDVNVFAVMYRDRFSIRKCSCITLRMKVEAAEHF